MSKTFNAKKYCIEYNKRTYKTYTCRLNKKKDKDVIDKIYAAGNSTAYIKELVRNNTDDPNFEKLNFRLKKVEDKDIIDWLNKQPNKTEYIKALIKADIENVNKNHS